MGVKSRRCRPYVFIMSQKNSEYGGHNPQWKKTAKKKYPPGNKSLATAGKALVRG